MIKTNFPSMRELGRYRKLCREIKLCTSRIAFLENKLERHEDLTKLKFIPSDEFEVALIRTSLKNEHDILKKRLLKSNAEVKKLYSSIEEISDPQIRMITEMRFIHGMSWVKISLKLGGYNTPDAIRQYCTRWFKKCTYNSIDKLQNIC